jgi:UDP-glucuronate 4-epimerase
LGKNEQKVALVTGSAGFIGYHIARKLLNNGWKVIGVDCISDYYDVKLKQDREKQLLQYKRYKSFHRGIEEPGFLVELFEQEQPQIVIHLAAQAGVRYSIDNPRAYMNTNIMGTFELLEAARLTKPAHVLIASTSSAYGANENMPYKESQRADHQVSIYAATKKSTENLAHSYAHLFNIPTTIFRFFTVYGPWGRPDMALFRFTKAILNEEPIDVYNYGNMKRDFTYIDDLIEAIYQLVGHPPATPSRTEVSKNTNLSPVAPYRLINIGNSKPVNLGDFVAAVETALGRKAIKNLLPLQDGDVLATWADTKELEELINFSPQVQVAEGVHRFVDWYKNYYQ